MLHAIHVAATIVAVIASVLAVVITLATRHKGGGMSSMFGTSTANSVSASTIAERNLNRSFWICLATVIVSCIVALATN